MTIEIDGNRLEYEFYPDIFSGERHVSITGRNNVRGNITIPAEIDGFPVKELKFQNSSASKVYPFSRMWAATFSMVGFSNFSRVRARLGVLSPVSPFSFKGVWGIFPFSSLTIASASRASAILASWPAIAPREAGSCGTHGSRHTCPIRHTQPHSFRACPYSFPG